MGRIIEAKAVISAEDRTGKAFDDIARKFREMGKGAKASAEVGKLAKELDNAQAGLKSLEKFRGAQASFAQARTAFRSTQTDIARITKELDGARKAAAAFDGIRSFSKSGSIATEMAAARRSVTDLERQFTSAQRAVKAHSSAYESQASALKGVKAELNGSGLGVGKLVAEENRLKTAIEGANGAMRRQEQLLRAEGRLAAGMGAAGAGQAARIAQGRYLTEGMGLSGRQARAQQDAREASIAERKAQRAADRRDAAGTVAAGAGLYVGHKGKEIGLEAIMAASRMDYAVRYQHIATDVTEEMQRNLLLPQAKRIGQETKFSNEDVVEAQTATMQGLPYKDPDLKAKVGAALVDQARNYAVLFQSSLTSGSEGLRSFLQNTNKDMSTPEKAEYEARRGTNLIVKAAKLGGMSNEDAQQYIKFGIPTATQAGFSDVTSMALGALARRSGLKGDEAGVFVRAASSKLISPTKEGREAEIMAGIDRSKYQKMPEQLSSEAFEKIGKGRFGVHFSANQRGRLGAMFRDGDLLTDQAEFTKRVSAVVSESFEKTKKGKLKAQDAGKIAKLANDFYKMSVESTDVEGLLQAHMNSPTFTAALRNKFYTDKHGGKAGILANKFDQFKEDREALDHVTKEPNFAGDRAKYMTQGLGGSIDNLKGSFETLVLNIGTANSTLIQGTSDQVSKLADAVSGFSDKTVQAGTVFAAIAASGASAASALAILGKLSGSSVLTGLAGIGAAGMLPVLGGVAAAGALYAGSDESKGLVHGGRPDQAMNPGDELPGLDGWTDAPTWAKADPIRPNRPSIADGVKSLIDSQHADRVRETMGPFQSRRTPLPPARGVDASGQTDAIRNSLDAAASASATAANGGKPVEVTVKPDQIVAKVTEIPPVTGEATLTILPQRVIVELNSDMLTAKVASAVASQTAKVPLASSGARPGAVSMPGAASTPGQ